MKVTIYAPTLAGCRVGSARTHSDDSNVESPSSAFPVKAGTHVWLGHRPSPVWQNFWWRHWFTVELNRALSGAEISVYG
jgi:hypothetical protein